MSDAAVLAAHAAASGIDCLGAANVNVMWSPAA